MITAAHPAPILRALLRASLAAVLLALAVPAGRAQQRVSLLPDVGGDGSDGAYVAVAGAVLDSDVKPVWNFTTFAVPAGITLRCRGRLPLEIRVQGVVRIDGVLDASGRDGGSSDNDAPGGTGGEGGPGAGPGGEGGAPAADRFRGAGAPGGGRGGGAGGADTGAIGGSFQDPSGGGGGGANVRDGFDGGAANSGRVPSGSGAGGLRPTTCREGSGGGGGAADLDSLVDPSQNDGGGGGGGGGGRLAIFSGAVVQIGAGGAIRVDGGRGGDSLGNGGGGGGGSGGFAELVAPLVVIDGAFHARPGAEGAALQSLAGSAPGGRGASGCLRVAAAVLTGSGTADPEPLTSGFEIGLGPRSAPVGIDVVLSDPTGAFATGLAVFPLEPPIQVPGVGLLGLDPTDFVFRIVIGQPAFPPTFTGLTGGASGRIVLTPPRLDPSTRDLDLVMYLQVFAFDGNGFWNGLSDRLAIHFLF